MKRAEPDGARAHSEGVIDLGVLFRLPPRFAYPATITIILVVISLRAWLDTFGERVIPFALFFPAILCCTLMGGLGPGMLALAMSMVAAKLFWIEPGTFFGLSPVGIVNLVTFFVAAGAVLAVGAHLRATLYRLRRSERRLELAQRAGRIGMWDVDVRSGKTWWSDLLYEITGIGREVRPSIDAFVSRIHPDDRLRVLSAFEDARLGERNLDTEFRYQTDDGRQLMLVARAEVFKDHKGRPKRLTGVNVDVTSLRGAEAERDRANSLLQTFFDTLPGAAYAKDTEGRTLMGNPLYAAAVGRDPLGFLGKTDLEMQPDKALAQTIMENDRRVMAEGVTQEIEEDLVLPDGRLTHWLSIKTPFREPDGGIRGIVGVSLDVTERRRAEERLRLLAYEVDHRAKNLLAVVQSVVRLTEVEDVAAFKVAVGGRIQALARAHSLLAASRWEGVTIGRLVEEELMPFASDDDDRIFAAGPSLMLQPGAAQAIAMALHELATNAAKYGALSTEQGRVSLSWRALQHDPEARLEVVWSETDGPPVTLPTRAGFGSAVIAGSIRQQLGGEVTFDWKPDGIVCRISVPFERLDLRHNHHATAKALRRRSAKGAASLSGKRVLIVEDEALIALMLAEAVSDLGCEIAGSASTPEDSLEFLRCGGVDLAIVDLNLAGRSSAGVAGALRALGIPFVYCTGYADRLAEMPEAVGGEEVVTKPAAVHDLADALLRAIDRIAHTELAPT